MDRREPSKASENARKRTRWTDSSPRWRDLVAAALSTATVLALAGCGSGNDPDSVTHSDSLFWPSSSSVNNAHRVRFWRLWNGAIHDHFYTASSEEAKAATLRYGFTREDFESIYVFDGPGDGRVPLYRYYSGLAGDHFYTTQGGGVGEIAPGYRFESVAAYVYTNPGDGRVRLYRYYSSVNSDHFYTTLSHGEATYPGHPHYALEAEEIWVYTSSEKPATSPPEVYFDSDTANWPPRLYNNPTITTLVDTMPPGVFVCPYYGQTDTLPLQQATLLRLPRRFSGVSTSAVTMFQPQPFSDPDGEPASFVNFSGRTIGTWLNSNLLTGNYGLVTFTPAARLATPVYPWAEVDSKLSLRWVMNVFRAGSTSPTTTPAYMVNYIVLQNPTTGARLWLGGRTYDMRGAESTWVGYDRGTQMGIVNGKLEPLNPIITLGPSSSTFQEAPWGTERIFDMVVTREGLRYALALFNQQRPAEAAAWPTDDTSLSQTQVIYFGLNPEIGGSNAQQKATLGATYRSIRLSKISGDL
ncbi:MAG: hypothetical protein IPK13_00840 [Deltaproteobacteria bacterium]|nr:hypothetical protein [Deltaproteobacteria bacterium]